MPYPRGYYFVGGLLLLTVLAFWPSYFSQLGAVPWQYHVHGVAAVLWMLLLIWQSWSIHHGRRAAHRSTGRASFVLTPLFLAGSLLVIATMANGAGQFRAMFGARLAIVDIIAVAAFAYFVFNALAQRRNVGLHAGYMLATAFLLFGPVAARLIPAFVPGLTIRALEELPRFATAFHIGNALAFAGAIWIYARSRPGGRPFALAAAVVVAQSAVFETIGRSSWWGELIIAIADISPLAIALTGLGAGVAVVYAGWSMPGRAQKPEQPQEI